MPIIKIEFSGDLPPAKRVHAYLIIIGLHDNGDYKILTVCNQKSGKYGFPGGCMIDSDIDAKQCATRETCEELGLVLPQLNGFYMNQPLFMTQDHENVLRVFYLFIMPSLIAINKSGIQKEEIKGYKWLSLSNKCAHPKTKEQNEGLRHFISNTKKYVSAWTI